MDGLLIVDKPVGPTSHDVVVRVRHALGVTRIGHTGTLDPAASGVLPLVLGRATRLARFLSAADKTYEAAIRLGVATTTGDAEGTPAGPTYTGPLPSRHEIERALDEFRGTFLQQPPAYSAKKIAGRRSYKIARAQARQAPPALPASPAFPAPPALPAPVPVTAHAVDLLAIDGDTVTVRIDCSAGFYVRSLAHDLGARLGTGAHLLTLRRTRSGDASVEEALSLDSIERDPERARRAATRLSGMLPQLPAVVLTVDGVRRALHGQNIGPGDTEASRSFPAAIRAEEAAISFVRLLDAAGELVAIAGPVGASGLLHPDVVLI